MLRLGAAQPRPVDAARPDAELQEELRWIVERHHELTGSPRAARLLADREATADAMWWVAPAGQVRRWPSQPAGRVVTSA